MAYTMADFNRYFVKKHIHLLTAEELKELLRSVPVEIRLAGVSMEDIKRYVDRLAAQRPALPRKPQRKK